MKRIVFFTSLAIVALFSACTAEETEVVADTLVSNMRLDAPKPYFGGQTRADASGWNDGDCVYLTFSNGTECVSGKAIYNASESSWMLEYGKPLQATESSQCQAYYFEGDYTDNGSAVTLYPTTCVYYDAAGTYRKDANGIIVKANMFPMSGRVRFTGTAGQQFVVSGATSMTTFNRADASFNTSDASLSTTVSAAGYTPYLYMSFADDTRTLEVAYDRLSFSKYCDRPILDAGQSGYMTLPTKDKHSGWTMVETTVPTAGVTTVSDVEANSAKLTSTIVSNGNAPITDCGFCYSLTTQPTVANMTVSCGTSNSSFSTTLIELKKNTTYYVRAYATNEVGTVYGEETSFTTTAGVIAVTNGLTALYLFENNFDDYTENKNDGFGMSSPTFVPGVDEDCYAVKFTAQSYMRVGVALNESKTHSTAFWIKDPGDGSIYATITNGSVYKGPTMSLEMENGQLRYVIDPYYNTHESYRNDVGKLNHPSLTDGNWHHIALVTDNGVVAYGWHTILYIDGKRIDTISEQKNSKLSGMSFQLGGNIQHGNFAHEGAPMTIDNFRTYKRCLSDDEIKAIYESEKQ